LYGPALNGSLWPERPFRIHVSSEVPVVDRIRIDQDAGGASLLRDECFYTAKVVAVTNKNEFPAHIYS
jgi:hypothetical protein